MSLLDKTYIKKSLTVNGCLCEHISFQQFAIEMYIVPVLIEVFIQIYAMENMGIDFCQ